MGKKGHGHGFNFQNDSRLRIDQFNQKGGFYNPLFYLNIDFKFSISRQHANQCVSPRPPYFYYTTTRAGADDPVDNYRVIRSLCIFSIVAYCKLMEDEYDRGDSPGY